MKTTQFTVHKGMLVKLLDYLDPNEKVEIETSIIPECYDITGPLEMVSSFIEWEDSQLPED